MLPNIQKIQENILPLRTEIINHQVYKAISEIEDLCIFMEHHIFAVWDFMSLLKALQINLTCTTLPWFPVGDPVTRQLINQIVAGEESDVDANGAIKSHFELYIDAMEQCGANTQPILRFIDALQKGKSLTQALEISEAPVAARAFVLSTFETINAGKAHLQAASFTFGREDLIPGMFYSMVKDLNSTQPEKVSIFNYYLERHIEVDGDEHSHLALSMTEKLCEKNEQYWTEAEEITKQALKMRINLWDAAYLQISKEKAKALLA
ncbi:DUF3050 domain-containing protein [Pedobacter sp. MW01-1-1]|uniref:DUF3050 domain-containing protein n=1 Tax=Pedobacter sp. MW01-1-1 TaxID=3383027 RepID=UPI003FEFD623